MPGSLVNVVLVEDDALDVMNVERAFAKAKISSPLFVARDGLEALSLLRSDRVPPRRRVVMLDLNMPRMNGFEFLAELRADRALASTPVVVLTTSNDDRDRLEAYRFNVAGYLLKTVEFSGFVQLIEIVHRYWRLVEQP